MKRVIPLALVTAVSLAACDQPLPVDVQTDTSPQFAKGDNGNGPGKVKGFPTEGLVAWYPFNGNANDESGNGYDGALTSVTFTNRGSESAISFQANADDYVTVPEFAETFSTGFSASVWAASSAASTTGQFFHRRTNNNIDFAVEPLYFAANVGLVNSRATPPPDEWHHYVFTYDGATMRVFMDGTLVVEGQASGSLSTNTTTLVFGKYVYNGSLVQYFNGMLDDVGFWNRALTPEEIAYLASN